MTAIDDALRNGYFVDVRGVRTHAHVTGDGPPVVLIHGSGPGVSAWANWQRTLPSLAEHGFRAHAYDVLGFGYTDREAGVQYGMSRWVEHLRAFIEDVVKEPVLLIGNSLGGAMCLRVATERPDLIRRMVLMGPGGLEFEVTPALDFVWGYTPSLDNMRTLVAEHFAYDRSLATPELVQMRYEASMLPGNQEAYAAMFPPPRQRWVATIATPEEKLRQIQTPALIFHGREDRIVPLSVAYRLLDLLPNAQLHVFGKCGHWTMVECAPMFNAITAAFFEPEKSR